MSNTKRPAHERTAELRAILGCSTTERTVDAARRLVAELDKARLELADTGKALSLAWERAAQGEQREGASDAN